MSPVTCQISVFDGVGAGPHQNVENPLGKGSEPERAFLTEQLS